MKVDTQLRAGLDGIADEVTRLAGMGLDGAFTFEGQHDVFFPLVRAAGAAEIDLYTNVAIAFPRSPMHLAYSAYDLHTLTGGRFRLGLGSQIKPAIEKRYSAAWARPVPRMRELVLAVKAIFAAWHDRERLDFRGEFFTHTLMTPNFDPGPNPYGKPPVLVGALGPRMTAATAEVADGLLIMPFNSDRFLREQTMPAVARGLEAGGRSGEGFEIIGEVIVCAGRDEREIAAAEAGVRMLLAFYGSTPSYRPVLDAEGFGDLQPELNTMSKQGRWKEMAGLIDDDVLRRIAVYGTPAECAAQVATRFDGIASRVAFYTPYAAPDDLVGEVATAISAV